MGRQRAIVDYNVPVWARGATVPYPPPRSTCVPVTPASFLLTLFPCYAIPSPSRRCPCSPPLAPTQPHISSCEAVSNWQEKSTSPNISIVKTIFHPGEVRTAGALGAHEDQNVCHWPHARALLHATRRRRGTAHAGGFHKRIELPTSAYLYLTQSMGPKHPVAAFCYHHPVCSLPLLQVAASTPIDLAARAPAPIPMPPPRRCPTLPQVNKIRELPQHPHVVVTHTDSELLHVWNMERQPDRRPTGGTEKSTKVRPVRHQRNTPGGAGEGGPAGASATPSQSLLGRCNRTSTALHSCSYTAVLPPSPPPAPLPPVPQVHLLLQRQHARRRALRGRPGAGGTHRRGAVPAGMLVGCVGGWRLVAETLGGPAGRRL